MSATDSQRAVRTGLPLLRGPSQGAPFDFDGDAEKNPKFQHVRESGGKHGKPAQNPIVSHHFFYWLILPYNTPLRFVPLFFGWSHCRKRTVWTHTNVSTGVVPCFSGTRRFHHGSWIPCQALVPIYAFWWHPSFTHNTWTNATCCKQFLVVFPWANEQLKGESMDSTYIVLAMHEGKASFCANG